MHKMVLDWNLKVKVLIVSFLFALLSFIIYGEQNDSMVIEFSKVSGAGCPYTASWMVNTNLFIKAPWWMESTKMEAASFNVFDKAKNKFQLSDPDAFYVHHMSMYEHFVHRKEGFDEAQRRTLILSKAALAGECNDLVASDRDDFVALIPFYGGLPPNVTKDLSVKSIGQGNSLVNASVKVLQCMATLCSCLKYFGRAVVGTTRPEDLVIVEEMLLKLPPIVRQRTEVVSFRMPRPAHLPFHLLAWGQFYVQTHNCPPPDASKADILEYQEKGHISHKILHGKSEDYLDKYRVCTVNVFKNHHGISFNATHHPYNPAKQLRRRQLSAWLSPLLELATGQASDSSTTEQLPKSVQIADYVEKHGASLPSVPLEATTWKSSLSWNRAILSEMLPSYVHLESVPTHNPKNPIKHVYYTECDQVVRFDSMETMKALVASSNDTTFFVGRRREKTYSTDPADYMSNLDIYRNCGTRGYSLSWPKENIVRMDG